MTELSSYKEAIVNNLDTDTPLKKSFFANLHALIIKIYTEYPIHAESKQFRNVFISLDNSLKINNDTETINGLQKLLVLIEKA